METFGDLVDKLTICNIRLWHLEEIKHNAEANDKTVADAARKIAIVNKQRNILIDEINSYLSRAISGEIKTIEFPKMKLY